LEAHLRKLSLHRQVRQCGPTRSDECASEPRSRRASSRIPSLVITGLEWVSSFLSLLRCFSLKPETLLNPEPTSVSFSKMTLTSFLSPLPPTTPDIGVVLPDSGRCELAVRQQFVGRSDPGVAALDQVTQVRILEGQSKPA